MTDNTIYISCPNPVCGIPVTASDSHCPKCDTSLHAAFTAQYLEIDVAHFGQTREEARMQILEGLNHALLHRYKGLRVIHGYGGPNRNRGVIAREAVRVMQELANHKGYVLRTDGENPGAHVLDFEM